MLNGAHYFGYKTQWLSLGNGRLGVATHTSDQTRRCIASSLMLSPLIAQYTHWRVLYAKATNQERPIDTNLAHAALTINQYFFKGEIYAKWNCFVRVYTKCILSQREIAL